MTHLIAVGVLIGTVVSFCSCDTFHAIERSAPLSFLPDVACVDAVIQSIPEVRNVKQWAEESRTLTLTGIQTDRLYYFVYELGSTEPALLLTVDEDGEVQLSQHFGRLNSHVSQEEIDLVRPAMLRIEAGLEERCGLELPPIKERITSCCGSSE